jgi:hypothetical protein
MRVPDRNLVELRENGFTVVERFLEPELLREAQEALWSIYPRPEEYFSNREKYSNFAKSQFHGIRLFPYPSWALNRITVHPDLIDAAERFLGTDDLHLYKVELWAKYAGAINYDQPHHRDYGNHTLTVPSRDGRHMQLTTFILLSEVTENDAPTKVIPLDHSQDIPFVPREQKFGDYFDREVSVTGPAGSLFMYRTDVLHRGSDFKEQGRSRFAMLVDLQPRGWRWTGKIAWPDRALAPGWVEAMERMTVRERDLFGFPPPGDAFWTEQTLRDTQARYPKMDMSAYRRAMIPGA